MNDKLKHFLLSLFFTAAFWLPCYAWQGWLGSFVWRWFAVEIFGARAITTWQAAGVICLVNYFMPTQIRDSEEDGWPEKIARVLVYGFLIPGAMFVSAYFVRRMM